MAVALAGCAEAPEAFLFTRVDESAGINFLNQIEETSALNIISYEYLYNGAGVAAADFNNDGNTDIFFVGNQVPNKLFLNKGTWHFEDVTAQAGVGGKNGWRTGVTVADVNSDDLPDIYVCYSGPGKAVDRANELWINKGGEVPTFEDQAKEYNLDAPDTYSTQASFFDYDLDGDLDMFLLNHARITYSPFYNTKKLRNKRHPRYGNRLYRNDGGKYLDVSSEAGIHGSGINFGLGISISDLNLDGWPDLYVTNDYEEQDFFYLNNHDGTFSECLKESFRHIARFGMGVDAADFNNDMMPDVFVADMLPEDNYRQKLLKGPDEYDKYTLLRDSGYHHQNMRNMLQVNLGNSQSNKPRFSEIGQLAGVSATDWSWSPLFADFDNDGWKDLFITNGYLRDYTNLDFLKYTFEDYKSVARSKGIPLDTISLIKEMPATKLTNYAFRNGANLQFKDVSRDWGFHDGAVSSGALYADLDNDGDQDLVVNNLNERSFVYRNDADKIGNHFIRITLKGTKGNSNATGARIIVKTDSLNQLQEVCASRGFQSASFQPALFGVEKRKNIHEIIVQWPDLTFSKIRNVPVDTLLTISYGDHRYDSVADVKVQLTRFSETTAIPFTHSERAVVDFKSEFLLPYQLSSNGPCMAKGDVNMDGNEDLFIGGGAGQKSELFIANREGGFYKLSGPWYDDAQSEDTDATFFDADNDDDPDLYVVSGSHEFTGESSRMLQDRLYVNDGNGKFHKADLPRERSNGSAVSPFDFDKDGDTDLFVAGKSLPGYFPLPAYSYLLRNDSREGKIVFVDVTPDELKKPGMINDCLWMDVDNDSWSDLILAGEFMPILVAKNNNGVLQPPKNLVLNSNGLWSTLASVDLDADGDLDLLGGNAGLNTQMKASPAEPMTIQFNDYNEDGRLDPILSWYMHGKSSVYPSRDEILEQVPQLKKKFVKYEQYANAALTDILTPDQLETSKEIQIHTLASVVFLNKGNGNFEMSPLPIEAQFSKTNAFITDDFDSDGVTDILLAGNYFPYRVQIGRSDAGSGLLLHGEKGKIKISVSSRGSTGFYVDGDVRSMQKIMLGKVAYVVVGINNSEIKLYKIKLNESSILASSK
jgi:hypothetical protein